MLCPYLLFKTTFYDGLFFMPYCSWITSASLFQTFPSLCSSNTVSTKKHINMYQGRYFLSKQANGRRSIFVTNPIKIAAATVPSRTLSSCPQKSKDNRIARTTSVPSKITFILLHPVCSAGNALQNSDPYINHPTKQNHRRNLKQLINLF